VWLGDDGTAGSAPSAVVAPATSAAEDATVERDWHCPPEVMEGTGDGKSLPLYLVARSLGSSSSGVHVTHFADAATIVGFGSDVAVVRLERPRGVEIEHVPRVGAVPMSP
jgi:hypothetical protein